MKSKVYLAVLLLPLSAAAQDDYPQKTFNAIPVASPILVIAPDARSSGMGDVGAATTPDANSQHWNAAKYAFIPEQIGGCVSYSPWLRGLVNDVNIGYVSFFYKLAPVQTLASSLRYFSLGNMDIVNQEGVKETESSPYELAFDVSYSRKFSEDFSISLTGRYIRSDLTGGVTGNSNNQYDLMTPANAWSFDIGAYYQTHIGRESELAFGLALTNLGSKINYNQDASNAYFLPMNIRLGSRYTMSIDGFNTLAFALDFNKLLVPTPPVWNTDGTEVILGKDNTVTKLSVPGAIIQSFSDAPFGFSEELAEITTSIGGEWAYNNTFFGRIGGHYDSKRKGNRRYMTFGMGFQYGFMRLDLAYYVTFTNTDPMANTIKFALGFYFN